MDTDQLSVINTSLSRVGIESITCDAEAKELLCNCDNWVINTWYIYILFFLLSAKLILLLLQLVAKKRNIFEYAIHFNDTIITDPTLALFTCFH